MLTDDSGLDSVEAVRNEGGFRLDSSVLVAATFVLMVLLVVVLAMRLPEGTAPTGAATHATART